MQCFARIPAMHCSGFNLNLHAGLNSCLAILIFLAVNRQLGDLSCTCAVECMFVLVLLMIDAYIFYLFNSKQAIKTILRMFL